MQETLGEKMAANGRAREAAAVSNHAAALNRKLEKQHEEVARFFHDVRNRVIADVSDGKGSSAVKVDGVVLAAFGDSKGQVISAVFERSAEFGNHWRDFLAWVRAEKLTVLLTRDNNDHTNVKLSVNTFLR
jgi:hypothetical protein